MYCKLGGNPKSNFSGITGIIGVTIAIYIYNNYSTLSNLAAQPPPEAILTLSLSFAVTLITVFL